MYACVYWKKLQDALKHFGLQMWNATAVGHYYLNLNKLTTSQFIKHLKTYNDTII